MISKEAIMADEPKAAPKSSKSIAAGKYFDVTPAKETVAPMTSRPIIVGHASGIQKDPMVSAGNEAEDTVESEKLTFKREKVLEPVSTALANEDASESTSQTGVSEKQQQESVDNKADEPDQAQTKAAGQESGAVDAIISEVNTKKEREKDEDERLKKEAEVAELAASKKYYVKIQTPASKRKTRLLSLLLIASLIGGTGWYFGVGPGVEMWSKDVSTQTTVTPATEATSSNSRNSTQQPKTTPKATFADAKLGLAFSYPGDWKVAQAKDSEFPTRDVLTITSPSEKLNIVGANDATLEAEVFFRTRVFVQNTTNPKEYASDLVRMSSCTSEDMVVAGSTMKLLFVDYKKTDPAVSQLALSPENCVKNGAVFNGNDQIQFTSKKNTFIVYSELVFSENHLKKTGTTTPEAIALAQEKGITINKSDLLKSAQYAKFKEIVSSLREEIAP